MAEYFSIRTDIATLPTDIPFSIRRKVFDNTQDGIQIHMPRVTNKPRTKMIPRYGTFPHIAVLGRDINLTISGTYYPAVYREGAVKDSVVAVREPLFPLREWLEHDDASVVTFPSQPEWWPLLTGKWKMLSIDDDVKSMFISAPDIVNFNIKFARIS